MKTFLTLTALVVALTTSIAQNKKEEPAKMPTPEPLYILDGQEIKKEYVDSLVHRLDADKIHTVEVFKDAATIEKYGERAKNGVVMITTKDARKPEE